jgi:hypothetical protein
MQQGWQTSKQLQGAAQCVQAGALFVVDRLTLPFVLQKRGQPKREFV